MDSHNLVTHNNYKKVIDLFIQRGDIDQLVSLWKTDKTARLYINDNLDELKLVLGITNVTKNSFEEIIIEYHKSQIRKIDDQDKALDYALNIGYYDLVNYVIEKFAIFFDELLEEAEYRKSEILLEICTFCDTSVTKGAKCSQANILYRYCQRYGIISWSKWRKK